MSSLNDDLHLAVDTQTPSMTSPVFHSGNRTLLAHTLLMLSQPPDLNTNPYWQTDIGKVFLTSMRFCIELFIQAEFNNRFSFWNPSRKDKKFFQPEVDLWINLFRMLDRLSILDPDASYPAYTFYCVITEGKACLLNFNQGYTTKTPFILDIRRENRELRALNNPFEAGKSEESIDTKKLFDLAISQSEKNDLFRKNFYMPFVRARMTAVTALAEKDTRMIGDGMKLEHRGYKGKT